MQSAGLIGALGEGQSTCVFCSHDDAFRLPFGMRVHSRVQKGADKNGFPIEQWVGIGEALQRSDALVGGVGADCRALRSGTGTGHESSYRIELSLDIRSRARVLPI